MWIPLHLYEWGACTVMYIQGRNFRLLSCVTFFTINIMHLSGHLGSFRVHNTLLLRLDVFLGNWAVGEDYLLFALLLWNVHSPMLIVPWEWWDQRILHSRGFCQLFSVRFLLLWVQLSWSHMFWLVLVLPRRIYSGLRDMVNVVGGLISCVGILNIFFVM